MSAESGSDDRHGTERSAVERPALERPAVERLFVAWEPDVGTHEALARAAHAWRAAEPASSLRWQDPAQLHLTLRFLGATGAQQRTGIEAGLAALASRHAPAGARAPRAAAWPTPRAPRVLVLELVPDRALAELAAALETLARDCGFAAENRRFKPHFTLARTREGTRLGAALPAVADLAIRVDALSLVRSTPTPAGSRYDTVGRWPLAAP